MEFATCEPRETQRTTITVGRMPTSSRPSPFRMPSVAAVYLPFSFTPSTVMASALSSKPFRSMETSEDSTVTSSSEKLRSIFTRAPAWIVQSRVVRSGNGSQYVSVTL